MRQEDRGIRMGLIYCMAARKQQGDLIVRSIADVLSAHQVDNLSFTLCSSNKSAWLNHFAGPLKAA